MLLPVGDNPRDRRPALQFWSCRTKLRRVQQLIFTLHSETRGVVKCADVSNGVMTEYMPLHFSFYFPIPAIVWRDVATV